MTIFYSIILGFLGWMIIPVQVIGKIPPIKINILPFMPIDTFNFYHEYDWY